MSHAENDKKEHPQEGPFVTITINGKPYSIHRGRNTVTEIKQAGKVPLTEELAQEINHKLDPLADDGAVTIKGGEIFISYVRAGRSS